MKLADSLRNRALGAPICFLFVSAAAALSPACEGGEATEGDHEDGEAGGQGGGGKGAAEEVETEENEGEEAFLPLHESGSRLRAVTHGGSDGGPRLFVAWYDSELETECSFARASDGEYRCLPRGRQLGLGYRDAACTEAVYFDGLAVPCDSHAPYRIFESEAPCEGSRVYTLRPATDVATLYHETCEGEVALSEDAELWEDGEEIEPTAFVRAELVERANSDGIGVIEWRGEDGSRQVTRLFDQERGSCSPRQFGGQEEWRCTPNAAFLEERGWWFSGEDCSGEQLAYGSFVSECSDPVEYVLLVDTATLTYELATAGDPVEGTVWQQGFGADAQCTEHATDALLWTLYPVVEPYDETLLPLIERQNRGDGRLQLGHNVIDGTWLTAIAHQGAPFYDTEKNEECQAVRFRENEWLCIPPETPTIESLNLFSDSDCTEPVLQDTETPPELVLSTVSDQCDREPSATRILAVYSVGAAHEGAVYFVNHDGCVEYSDGNDANYYVLSQQTADFATMTEEID